MIFIAYTENTYHDFSKRNAFINPIIMKNRNEESKLNRKNVKKLLTTAI